MTEREKTWVTWGDHDAVIAGLVAERDAAHQEIQTLEEGLTWALDALEEMMRNSPTPPLTSEAQSITAWKLTKTLAGRRGVMRIVGRPTARQDPAPTTPTLAVRAPQTAPEKCRRSAPHSRACAARALA